jgi:hypothetical protein
MILPSATVSVSEITTGISVGSGWLPGGCIEPQDVMKTAITVK